MSWCINGTAWSALIELLVDNVNKNNGDIYKNFATLVNELMMTASKSDKSMTTAACYESRVNACLATRVVSQWWRVLIIIRIRFVCFLKMMSVGHILDYMLNNIILSLMTTALQLPSSLAWAPTNDLIV